MNRRHLRIYITAAMIVVALTIFAASAQAQLLGGKGGLLSKGSSCNESCEDCSCMNYTLNICRGQHDCCGCGCAHSGYGCWCGHGKNWGWMLQNGGIMPRCSRAHRWKQYYNRGRHGAGGCGCAFCGGSGGDLFYNYYAPQTGPGGGVTTQMYTSPHATPHPAPQTYYTYQPWLPHEHMYHHNRSYTQYHGCGGRTHTSVSYGGSPILRHYDP